MMKHHSRLARSTVTGLAVLLVINIGLLVFNVSSVSRQPSPTPNPASTYPYLSKRIFVENQNDMLINFTPLRTALRNYVAKIPEQTGVYFEYLPTGTSIGVNDQLEVRLASLIKVPVVMAVYKQVEKGDLSLDKTITMEQADLDDRFGTLWKRGVGSKLTVREIIRINLVESDNTATRMLTRQLPEGSIDDVFDSLDLPKEREDSGAAVISPKGYGSILRSLYLASYLDRDSSNDILHLLTITNFSTQLPAGIPDDIRIAHKIGIFERPGEQPIHNDCGIIYATNRPYLLCIMSAGTVEDSTERMVYISRMVYAYIAKASR